MADCNIEKTVKRVSDKIPYTYSLSHGELLQLCNLYREHGIIMSLIWAYEFGFCRGTRAKGKGRVPVL